MAEVRLSSVLGILRYWWRSTAGRSYNPDKRRAREIVIFGGPAAEDKGSTREVGRTGVGGTGCFSASLITSSTAVPFKTNPITKNDRLLQFLGNGVTSNRDASMPVGEYGELSLHFHPHGSAEHRAEVIQALDAMCAFGGVGLLCRRGLGSVSNHAPGRLALKDAISSTRSLFAELFHQDGSSTSKARLVLWPMMVPDGLEALSDFAAHLGALKIKADTKGNLERLSDLLSSQAGLQRSYKAGQWRPNREDRGRRPSPVSIKIVSCWHERRDVQLITALMLPSAFSSEIVDGAAMSLSDRLNLVFDTLSDAASAASADFADAFA